MNLFKIIEKAGLASQILEGLDAAKIIRIEKQLRALAKLDGVIKLNQALHAVEALKTGPKEILFILGNSDLHQLFLLKNIPSTAPIAGEIEPHEIASFIETFCMEEMSKIISIGLKKNYFSIFKTLYKYYEYIPNSINEEITDKLNKKLQNKILYLNQKKETQDNAIYKEAFYKTLNAYKNLETDELVSDLLDAIMYCFGEDVKGKTKYVIKGMTHYQPLDEELEEVIKSNGELTKSTWNFKGVVIWFLVVFALNVAVSLIDDNKNLDPPKIDNMYLRVSDLPETICDIEPATRYLLSYTEFFDSTKHAMVPSEVKYLHYKGKTIDTVDHFIKQVKVTNYTPNDLVFTEFRGNSFRHSVFIPSKKSAMYNLDTNSFFKLYFGRQLYTHDSTKKKINIPMDNVEGMMNSIKFMKLYRFNKLDNYNREMFRNTFKFCNNLSVFMVEGKYKIESKAFTTPDHIWMKDSFSLRY